MFQEKNIHVTVRPLQPKNVNAGYEKKEQSSSTFQDIQTLKQEKGNQFRARSYLNANCKRTGKNFLKRREKAWTRACGSAFFLGGGGGVPIFSGSTRRLEKSVFKTNQKANSKK